MPCSHALFVVAGLFMTPSVANAINPKADVKEVVADAQRRIMEVEQNMMADADIATMAAFQRAQILLEAAKSAIASERGAIFEELDEKERSIFDALDVIVGEIESGKDFALDFEGVLAMDLQDLFDGVPFIKGKKMLRRVEGTYLVPGSSSVHVMSLMGNTLTTNGGDFKITVGKTELDEDRIFPMDDRNLQIEIPVDMLPSPERTGFTMVPVVVEVCERTKNRKRHKMSCWEDPKREVREHNTSLIVGATHPYQYKLNFFTTSEELGDEVKVVQGSAVIPPSGSYGGYACRDVYITAPDDAEIDCDSIDMHRNPVVKYPNQPGWDDYYNHFYWKGWSENQYVSDAARTGPNALRLSELYQCTSTYVRAQGCNEMHDRNVSIFISANYRDRISVTDEASGILLDADGVSQDDGHLAHGYYTVPLPKEVSFSLVLEGLDGQVYVATDERSDFGDVHVFTSPAGDGRELHVVVDSPE